MYGWDVEAYEKRVASFGWETIVLDGHRFDEILPAFKKALEVKEKPVMLIARTVKGKGVPAIENKNGWHGKASRRRMWKRRSGCFSRSISVSAERWQSPRI